jgi:CRISPR-associated protein Cmr2
LNRQHKTSHKRSQWSKSHKNKLKFFDDYVGDVYRHNFPMVSNISESTNSVSMSIYHRKLYALLKQLKIEPSQAQCLEPYQTQLQDWWQERGSQIVDISKASDRVMFEALKTANSTQIRHLISAEQRFVSNTPLDTNHIISELNQIAQADETKAFWWLWRFYPEFLVQSQSDALLFPASFLIPDCPLHGLNSAVSAMAGAIPEDYEKEEEDKHPYLLLFTFSPVQEFIKASRKFLDFWAGSYLLHYLSAKLCWYIAKKYGPDAVITPSLWSQEIIDAMMIMEYPDFQPDFASFQDGLDPVGRFTEGKSTSLSTAGFPNVITAIVPGKIAAEQLGKELCDELKKQWELIANQVRNHIRTSVIEYLTNEKNSKEIKRLLRELAQSEGLSDNAENLNQGLSDNSENPNRRDIDLWKQACRWEWNKLWDAQIQNTWEPYWTAVPLGHPTKDLLIPGEINVEFDSEWIQDQESVAPSPHDQTTPTLAENLAYQELNIGTWWANAQSRLGQAIQAIKNTRNWQIPAAPGNRSTLSGQFSALHPRLHYHGQLREGGGVSSGSMQLFWQLMGLVYPGLFNGSEMLNALEITKRMAWVYGGVAESLGIPIENQTTLQEQDNIQLLLDEQDTQNPNQIISISSQDIYYEHLIRFPNVSSIAAARFVRDDFPLARRYWQNLARLIRDELPTYRNKFGAKTRGRAFNIPQVDNAINPNCEKGQDYNGAMFSSKWLAEDIGVETEHLQTVRKLVEKAHKECGFGDSSPADWWVIIVADGDGMGKYVSGKNLKAYQDYIYKEAIDKNNALFNDTSFNDEFNNLLTTRKRMGPATHVGLNRALLDFSNRIVPYLTEQRFCGKVVYSGGDDVLAVLPLADLPEYLQSLRAAWCGDKDPYQDPNVKFVNEGGYWQPEPQSGDFCGLPNRPLFTMGTGATMSAGIVIAHKSVPLPTVLEQLWRAEEDRAKEMQGVLINREGKEEKIPAKDGLCFRVIYGSGNILEASMKGHLLSNWWEFLSTPHPEKLSPVLYRLAEELPAHAVLSATDQILEQAAKIIINSRDEPLPDDIQRALLSWLNNWEDWAYRVEQNWQERQEQKQPEESREPYPIGCSLKDLAKLLRFSAFWLDKMAQQQTWVPQED